MQTHLFDDLSVMKTDGGTIICIRNGSVEARVHGDTDVELRRWLRKPHGRKDRLLRPDIIEQYVAIAVRDGIVEAVPF